MVDPYKDSFFEGMTSEQVEEYNERRSSSGREAALVDRIRVLELAIKRARVYGGNYTDIGDYHDALVSAQEVLSRALPQPGDPIWLIGSDGQYKTHDEIRQEAEEREQALRGESEAPGRIG